MTSRTGLSRTNALYCKAPSPSTRTSNVGPLPFVSRRSRVCAFRSGADATDVTTGSVAGADVTGVTVGSGSAFATGSLTTGAAVSAIGSTCGTSLVFAASFSATADADIVRMIDLSDTVAVGSSGWARWSVTRVSFVPISVASSALIEERSEEHTSELQSHSFISY